MGSRITQRDVHVSRSFPAGFLVLSALVGDSVVERRYLYTSKRTALRDFVAEVNGD